jgi:SAM-dependent methyltransferase
MSRPQTALARVSGEDDGRPGLTSRNFRRIAENGFGDGHNNYPHSMAWFRDRLYVGATRDNLVHIRLRSRFEIPAKCWPIPVPKDIWDLDLRAQIWRYDPIAEHWDRVFTAPLVQAEDGSEVPLSLAFRSMVVFQGASDAAPAIYVPTLSPAKLSGAVMLRSTNGSDFEVVSEPNLAGGSKLRSFRTLVGFKGWLFTSPTMGAERGLANMAGVATVLVAADPAAGEWRLANAPGFGEPCNSTVFAMHPFNGFLYAGTFNLAEGFQVWKTDAEGEPPFRWTKVMSHGAYRGRLNEAVVSMAVFNGSLYIGTGIQNGGYDRIFMVGPAAAELIRLHADDSWELIVGSPRSTPDGIRVPLSGMGPGFDNPFAGYFWAMCEHAGWLYLGTFDSAAFLPYLITENLPGPFRTFLDTMGSDAFQRTQAGFDLWRSRDGLRWVPVTRNGFGNPFNYGVRTMYSSPYGFFVGATNPFGPEVAVSRLGGWRYEANPRGGLEVWLGSSEASVPEPLETCSGAQRATPLRSPAAPTKDADRLLDEFYGQTGFRHIGYWRPECREPREACGNLLEELLSLLPEQSGRLLDVGCGLGATSAYLSGRFPAETVTGACETVAERAACQRTAGGVRVVRTPLPWLEVPDGSFAYAMCVESMAEWDREVLFRELLRVLQPGGRFVVADPLFAVEHGRGPRWQRRRKALAAPDGYRAFLEAIGFVEAQAFDTAVRCWGGFAARRKLFLTKKVLNREISPDIAREVEAAFPGQGRPIESYLIAAGRKPLREEPDGRSAAA